MKIYTQLIIVIITICASFIVWLSTGTCRVAVETYTTSGNVVTLTPDGELSFASGKIYYPETESKNLALDVRSGMRVNLRYYVRGDRNIYFQLSKEGERLPNLKLPVVPKSEGKG